MTAAERERLAVAMRLIERSQGRPPRLPDLAEASGMSPWHFHRRFTSCFGETPLQASTRQMVETAKRLMLEGENLAEVARRSGFSTQSHLSNRFKVLTGMTPSRWLRAHR